MEILRDSHQVSRLEVVETGRRRRWSEAEKLRIVEESFSRPRYASATARRYGIANKLLFAWRKAYREGRLGDVEVGWFVPAVVVPEGPVACEAGGAGGRMEVVSANGRRVVVGPDFDAQALSRLLDLVERRFKATSAQIRNLGTIGGNPVRRVRCPYFAPKSRRPATNALQDPAARQCMG